MFNVHKNSLGHKLGEKSHLKKKRKKERSRGLKARRFIYKSSKRGESFQAK